MPAVVEARKTKALGELNLTPYPAQCGNAAAWLRRVFAAANLLGVRSAALAASLLQCTDCSSALGSYGILVSNAWIIVPNVVGLLTGLFFCYTGYTLGNATQKGALFRSFARCLFPSVLSCQRPVLVFPRLRLLVRPRPAVFCDEVDTQEITESCVSNSPWEV